MNDSAQALDFNPNETLGSFAPHNLHQRYIDLLLSENQKINLVSRETSIEDLTRLVAESIFPLSQLDLPIQNYLDIGSGGGLPAVPILISGSISGKAVLVERIQKKSAALRRMLYALDLTADLPATDFDQYSPEGIFHLITIRLIRLTPELLEKASRNLHPEGVLIYYTVPDFDPEPTGFGVSIFEYQSGGTTKHFSLFRKS